VPGSSDVDEPAAGPDRKGSESRAEEERDGSVGLGSGTTPGRLMRSARALPREMIEASSAD
jgi:hypothetical protein